MPRLLPWSVFRRIPRTPDFELVGCVLAYTQDAALALASRLPNAPLHPIVCHAHVDPDRVIVGSAVDVETDRRNRRRAA